MVIWNKAPSSTLLLATTTSAYDSGLLDYIIPEFTEQYNTKVKILAVGTGQAIELGKNGDADLLLVHAPEQEQDFFDAGFGLLREEVMFNYFLIVGPGHMADFPDNAADFFRKLSQIRPEAVFCSRGDGSGTHIREQQLWELAGVEYGDISARKNADWYMSVGQGMGETLRTANEVEGFTLSDEATWLALRDELHSLGIRLEDDPALLNRYSIIVPLKTRQKELSVAFAEWITSDSIRQMINSFKREGNTLFTAGTP